MDGIVLELQRSIGDRFVVRASIGCGGWAKIPWIAISDPEGM